VIDPTRPVAGSGGFRSDLVGSVSTMTVVRSSSAPPVKWELPARTERTSASVASVTRVHAAANCAAATPVEIAPIVEACLGRLAAPIENRRLRVTIDVDAEIVGDRLRIRVWSVNDETSPTV